MEIQSDIFEIVNDYKSHSGPNDRYTSFDFCYNYFLKTDSNRLTRDMEKSCLTLGFYLASWGMFRNSFLIDKSIKYYESTIEYISSVDKKYWQIDVDTYTKENIEIIIDVYSQIKKRLVKQGCSDLTLVTKVQLGVFGFVPAFDGYFGKTFRDLSNGICGFSRMNSNALVQIKNFYEVNRLSIDDLASNTFTLDFSSGNKTATNYPKAKIIDMYGFNKRS